VIGAGILVVEAQEPTDFSILLEWTGFDLDGAAEGHLGLGFPTALGAVDVRRHAPDEVDALVHPGARGRSDVLLDALPSAAEAFFRVHLARPASALAVPPGFAVVAVLAGAGELGAADGAQPVFPGRCARRASRRRRLDPARRRRGRRLPSVPDGPDRHRRLRRAPSAGRQVGCSATRLPSSWAPSDERSTQ
jgi:hypothetical protein